MPVPTRTHAIDHMIKRRWGSDCEIGTSALQHSNTEFKASWDYSSHHGPYKCWVVNYDWFGGGQEAIICVNTEANSDKSLLTSIGDKMYL